MPSTPSPKTLRITIKNTFLEVTDDASPRDLCGRKRVVRACSAPQLVELTEGQSDASSSVGIEELAISGVSDADTDVEATCSYSSWTRRSFEVVEGSDSQLVACTQEAHGSASRRQGDTSATPVEAAPEGDADAARSAATGARPSLDCQQGDSSAESSSAAAWPEGATATPGAVVTSGSDVEEVEEDACGRTTVMLRNLPNNYTRRMLLQLLDEEDFEGQYNFLYLPIDFGTAACLGYAFVNCISEVQAQRLIRSFQGFSAWRVRTRKLGRASWSDPHQGLQANVERYRNSPVMHESVPQDFKPIVFKDGVPVPFPKPTKKVRAPRVRQHSL